MTGGEPSALRVMDCFSAATFRGAEKHDFLLKLVKKVTVIAIIAAWSFIFLMFTNEQIVRKKALKTTNQLKSKVIW